MQEKKEFERFVMPEYVKLLWNKEYLLSLKLKYFISGHFAKSSPNKVLTFFNLLTYNHFKASGRDDILKKIDFLTKKL